MAKKRTGLDALREYEARSGRQTQSEAQTEGSSGGAWRSGLDALRQFEANGGGRNVKNGEFNPNYRTMTRAMYESAYERYKRAAEAKERYSRAADAVGSSQVGGYLMAMQQPLRQDDRPTKQPNFAEKTVEHDQESGQRRTQYELRRQIDQLEKARDYALSMQAGDPEGLPELRGAYEAVNAGRTEPMTLTEMDEALREKRYRRAVMEKSVSGRLGEYAVDLGRGVFKGGFEQAMTGFESVLGYLEQGANGAAAWALRDLAKAVPDGGLKDKMLALADDFNSYYTGESMTSHEEIARLHRQELEKLEAEIADKYKGVPLWIQQQMPSLGNMLFGAGVSGSVGVNNLATLGVTAGGNSALDAKEKGASDAQALAYGVVAGGLEVFSEKLFGGNPIYDTDAGLVNRAVGKLTDNKTIMKILNSKAFDIASEGLEEVVTEVLDPVAEWAIYNGNNTEFADAESIGNAFLGGVFLSVVGNVADAPNQIRQARYERVLRTAGSELADIAQTVDSAPVQEAAQVIRDKIAYGVTPDAADIGAVLDAIDQAGETVDVEQVREAVTAEEGAAETAQREENFRAYSRYAEERDARARAAEEEVSQVRAQEYTEAINDAEADAADAAFEKLNKAEVSGALDAQARWQAEDARAERQFEVESREDTDRALSEAAQRYGYDERMTRVLLSGYSGAQSTQQYAEAVNAAYEYGKSGMSRTAAQRAAQGIDKALADEAWSAGKEIANGEKAGAARIDDGGKRNAGMDSGKQAGAVAGGAGGAADAAFEKLNKAEVSGALDAQARWQAEDARAERQFEVESREDTDRALSEAAQRYGYDERMTRVLLSGYSGAQSTQQYAEAVNAAYEYGKSGMSRTAAQRAAQGIDKALADEAWSAGKEIANGEKAGAARIDDGGKRNAGMDSGKQAGAVAGGAGGAAARSAAGRAVAERIGLENRVSAAGQPYLSGKDIGLSKGSAQRSFREAPQSTWTEGMKAAAGTLKSAGFADVHFTVGSISVENQRAKVTRYADGVAAGNSVWVNATAKKWSVQQLADHEAFHRQVKDTPGLLDSVRAVLADELGDSGIRELAQRYAEAYEGCYDGEELDAYIEEICADAYAGMDRFPEEKAKIIQKAARQAQDAQQAAEENGGTRGPPEKYSMVGYGENGLKTYKSDFSSDMTATEKQQYLYRLIKSVWSRKPLQLTILQDGKERSISARFDGESNGQEFAGKMAFGNRRGTRTERLISLNLADDIWEIASESTYDASKGGIKETLAHDGSERWHYFVNAINYVDEQQPSRNGVYDFNLDVMEREDGNFVYTFALKKRRDNAPRTFAAGVNGNNAADANSSDTSIRRTEQKSQEKFSADDTTATPQENDKAALAYFGRTYKWSETGYVLLNGARLDFSGRHEGGSGGYRSVDHRDIIDALGEDYGGGDYTGGMVRFMQEGNIRISPESGGINLAVMPTKAQMDSLSDFISKERGEVILDIDDASGNTISSTEYPRGTHANKVLQDIRNYFNDGTLPEVSNAPSVSQFRYSVAEEAAESDAGAGGTTAFTLDSIPKKAQDYLRGVRGQTAAAIQQTLSMPFAARKEVLKPAIEEMMNEYLQTGRISQETVDRSFEESYRRGVEMDTEFYDEYKDVKTRLRDLKVTLSETDRADIADFDDFRRAASGRLRIADEGGLPVDVAYKEMQQMAPELFPAGITHPADQLMQMFEVSKRIERVQRSLDEFHGAEAEEFKRWAKNDYEASVENMLGSLRVARRYAEARMRQKQARAVPTTMDEVKGLYAELKRLRRTYERAASKNLLTAEDNSVLNRLLRGDLAPEDVQGMENAKGILAMYEAKADYDATAAKIADWRRYQKAQRLAVADAALKNADQAKDKAAGIQYSRETMTRNVRDIFPEADAEIINRTYFEPVRTASANANKLKNQLREQVKALDLSRKANKGDAVSEAHAVQLLGEAQDNIRYLEQHPRAQDRDGKTLNEWRQIVLDLWATSPGLDRAKIENAVETFRKIYDGLFEQMNDVRIRNGYEPINYRQGYFPHFQPGTTDGILGLMGKALGIDAEVSALPTTISGLTHTFKPGIAYFGNALERIGFDTAYDAVEGFDKYVEGAASVICYTDVIQNLRALAQQVRYRTSDEGLRERVDDVRARDDLTEHQKELEIKEIMDKGRFSLSNFAIELDEYTNLLANKKSKYDRGIESLAGRKVYNLLKSWENRVAANMVAVNPASWLTNFGVITQAGAQLKTTSVLKAMGQTLKGWTKDDGFVERSDFLVNRRGSDPLVRTWQQSASAVLSKPMDWIDTFSADTIVRARYMENIARGMSEEEAMREADDFAANVMADRSKGAMPTIFESRNPLMKMFTQFQLEVNNTFSYLFKDLPREQRKKGVRYLAWALFKFLIGGYLYNEVYEYLIGRRPMLDPLGIVNDTVGDLTGYELNNLVDAAFGGGLIKESEPEGAIGTIRDMAVNVGQEAPFIGNLMGGGKLPFSSSMPNVKNILTALDSETATDEEKLAKVGKELINPAAYWLLPFGGGQVKKMWQGISALKRQGSYTADGRLQYPIYTDREGDKANAAWRTMLFGKSATPEAQAWVEAGFGALSEKATQTYEAMRAGGVDQRDSYELIKAMSKIKKTDDATAKELKMQMLLSFDIEDSGKVLYYYNMMATEKEKAQIDKLLADGADVGEYLRYIQAAAGVTGEKDADGKTISGSVKAETFALIDGLNLTPEQKTELAKEDYTPTGFEPWTENHDRLYKAISTGKDLRNTLKGLEKGGYEPKEIRAAITDMFRDEYLAADTAGKARLKGYLRNAFMASGLSKKEAENKIKKWEEAQK